MFKVGDEIVWPVRNIPGTIIAAGIKTGNGDNRFLAHIPRLHNNGSGAYDGIVYITADGKTLNGTPVRKKPSYAYMNVYNDVAGAWTSPRLMPMKPNPLGYLRGEMMEDGTITNIVFIPEEEKD